MGTTNKFKIVEIMRTSTTITRSFALGQFRSAYKRQLKNEKVNDNISKQTSEYYRGQCRVWKALFIQAGGTYPEIEKIKEKAETRVSKLVGIKRKTV